MLVEEQVITLELSKTMQYLGFLQDSLFYWCGACKKIEDKTKDQPCEVLSGRDPSPHAFISAYTVSELGIMLPWNIYKISPPRQVIYFGQTRYERWRIEELDRGRTGLMFEAETEADVRAKMLIFLKK